MLSDEELMHYLSDKSDCDLHEPVYAETGGKKVELNGEDIYDLLSRAHALLSVLDGLEEELMVQVRRLALDLEDGLEWQVVN